MADDKATYEINLVDKYSKKLNKAEGATDSFNNKAQVLGKTLTGVFAAGAVVSGITNLASMSLKLAGGMEQTEVAFNTFLGSAAKGREVLNNLNEFANQTPFTNAQIVKTGRALLAASIPAEKLTDTLRMVGDVAAGANVPINELGSIYAKAMNKGKLQAEELNQLAERGIPIIDELSQKFGVTKAEVFKLGSEGKITSGVMVSAFKSMTSKGGKFFNLMEKQSKTAGGLTSTLEGKVELLGINFGKKLLPAQKAVTKQTISLVDKLNGIIKLNLSDELESERDEFNSLLLQIRDVTKSEEDREKILARLKEINPKVNEIIKKEGELYVINADALREFNKQQINRIILQKEEEKIGKITAEKNELLIKQREAELSLARKINAFSEKVQGNQNIANRSREEFNAIISSGLSVQEKAAALTRKAGELTQFKGLTELRKLNLGTNFQSEIRTLAGVTGSLNEVDQERNDLLGERKKLIKDLGIDLGAGAISVNPTVAGLDGVEAGITKITSAAPKVFNININNLVENFEVSTPNLPEAAGEIRDVITQVLLEGLADVQPLVR